MSIFAVVLLASCEKDLPVWDDDQAALEFSYSNSADSIVNYSFIYSKGATVDTVWITVQAMGFVVSEDRYFEFEQIASGGDDAVAGKHYVSFDDASYKSRLRIPADSVSAKVPIIVMKDASLDDQTVCLKMRIKENGTFVRGYKETQIKNIYITNQLSQPTNWNNLVQYFFGYYGKVKHQFMIDNSDFNWDDEFLENLGVVDFSADQAYLAYLKQKFTNRLAEVNAERQAQGLGVLTEADGTVVKFSMW